MDFNKIGLLLHVAEKSKLWPSLNAIHQAAMVELQKLNDTPAPAVGGPRVVPNTQPAEPIERRNLDE